MKNLTGKILDKNENLITLENEKLLGKSKLSSWIHRKGILFINGPLAEPIFFSNLTTIFMTSQRIICLQETVVRNKKISYIEIPTDEIILCEKGLIGVNIMGIDPDRKRYYAQFSPRKEAVKFFNRLLKNNVE